MAEPVVDERRQVSFLSFAPSVVALWVVLTAEIPRGGDELREPIFVLGVAASDSAPLEDGDAQRLSVSDATTSTPARTRRVMQRENAG